MNKSKYKAKFSEKLMSNQVMIPQVFTAGYDIIDEICSDYESRTCENCKHWVREASTLGICLNNVSEHNIYDMSEHCTDNDFGCNKHERIQDGL